MLRSGGGCAIEGLSAGTIPETFPLFYSLGKIKVDQKIYRMATYHLLLVVEEIFDGRLELVETNGHGLGLSAISVSKGIFDFRV